jgi:transcriptional regulator with XRE-family HTH domain
MSNQQSEGIIKDLLSSKKDNTWREVTAFRQVNKHWLKKSAKVALKVLRTLRAKNMSQKELAERIGVSAQQISKIIKGRENITLETIAKLEMALEVELISILKEDEVIVKKNLDAVTAIARQILSKEYPKEAVTQSKEADYMIHSLGHGYRKAVEFRTSVTVSVNTSTDKLTENTVMAA